MHIKKRREKMAAIEAHHAEATQVSPLIGANDVADAWDGLTRSRQPAVIHALVTIT